MKILFVTPECAPLVKTGGLGDVSAALPQALARLGHEVVILMPAYAGVKLSGRLLTSIPLPATGPWPAAQLLHMDQVPDTAPDVRWLFLVCPQLYARSGSPYGDASGADHADNALRFALLSRVAARLAMPRSPLGWQPDVLHANDWPCGLAPLYLHAARPPVPKSATLPVASIITLHNMAFQGTFGMDQCDRLEIPETARGIDGVEFWGQMSMLKAAVQYADAITTVSPTYAHEIQTPAFGFGMEGVLRAHAPRITGILNGIDTQVWNPRTDRLIARTFDEDDVQGKAVNKAALQALTALKIDPQRMLFGLVSRLTEQKGVDLVVSGAERLFARGGQLVVLGQGDAALADALQALARKHPGKLGVTLGFNETLAHQIEAGADAFLMPSRFEPCGLNQMYSQAYGTPPIVSATGGLADTVDDADDAPVASAHSGTGFVMRDHTAQAFDDAVDRAFKAWAQPARWQAIRRAGMARDFGWESGARRYVEVYAAAIEAASYALPDTKTGG
ncbi:glycogen synthase GlgA [Variovorax sp. VNK109]|uniref:glycogen synthase GlgA n=1 Tax=Variovorax sp. VNK109 TaxID=3400919 RepID=UPI003BFAAFDA